MWMYTFFCILLLKFIMIYKYMCLFELLRSVLTQVQNFVHCLCISNQFKVSFFHIIKKICESLIKLFFQFPVTKLWGGNAPIFWKGKFFLCPIEFCVFICWHKMDFWLTFQCLFQVLSTDWNELPPRRKLTSDKPNVNHFSIQWAFIFFKLWTHIFFLFCSLCSCIDQFSGISNYVLRADV